MVMMTQTNIATLVQTFLNKHQPEGYQLKVEEQAIQQKDDLWHVTVVPDRPGVQAYDYAYHLTEMEDRILEESPIKVFLVPALVDD